MQIDKEIKNESWVDCFYTKDYQVSSFGAVRSVNRISKFNSIFYKGKVLKQFKRPSGYLKVNITVNGRQKSFDVHRLVIISFKGLKVNMVVNHINCNKQDNRLTNLEWVTKAKNSNDTPRNRKNKTSKFVGVYFDKKRKGFNKFKAHIRLLKKTKTLGYFKEEIEAALAYDNFLNINNIKDRVRNFKNHLGEAYLFNDAQMLIRPLYPSSFEIVKELKDTGRGGYG